METSLVQHLTPDLVRPLEEAGDGHARRFTVAGLRDGWAWAPRRWTKVTADTGTGNPKAATPEKGARYFDAVADRLAGLSVELAAADPEHLYA
jgi:creatinine amidohydrolase